MREIILDTETTGLDPATGDRIVEIGCLELVNRLPTGETYHVYINPERDMPPQAEQVHGLSEAFLRDKPLFADIVAGFLQFIGGDALVIHNADFDMKFLNAELALLGQNKLPNPVIDTLAMARKRFPGSPASLDALCRRFGVDNSNRDLHGALIDSELLAGVYLELSGGRQPDLVFQEAAATNNARAQTVGRGDVDAGPQIAPRKRRPALLAGRLSDSETAAHRAFISEFPQTAIWLKPQQDDA
ncbi:MAG: DNA polymerase III subunit epsilon [Parvibaculales bacterium]